MGRNLTSLPISASFQYLLQKSGSEVNDGLGADVDYLNISASYAYTASVADSATSATSASYATTATSASHAVQADSATSATTATSASHAVFADTAGSATTATSASHAVQADSALTADTATTASFVGDALYTGSVSSNVLTFTKGDGTTFDLTVNTGSAVTTPTGSLLTTASAVDATITFTKGDGSTFPVEINNVSSSISSSYALTATSASHAVNADSAISASYATQALSASFATSASYAPAGDPFPYTGSAEVSGSVIVDGLLQSGVGHTNSSTAGSNVLVGGDTHVISSGVQRSGMFAGWDSDITAGNASAIIAGGANALSSNYAVILGGEGNNVSAAYCGVLVGASNTISNADTSVIIGGYQNNVQGVRTTVLNGYQNVIQNTNVDGSTIIGGQSNTIPTGISQSAIIAGEGITADASDTVFVPNLHLTGSKGGTLTFADGTIQTSAGISFPYTGSAAILGTLDVNVSASVDGYTITSGSLSGSLIDNLGQQTIVTGSAVKHIVNLSQAEYDALTPDANTLYLISGSDAPFPYTGSAEITGSLIVTGSTDIDGVLSLPGIADVSASIAAAGGGGAAFPYTGSAQITGSLGVTGSVDIVASGTNAPFLNSIVSGAPSAGDALLAVASGDANINTSARASGVFGATNATIGSGGYQSVIVGGDEHDVNQIRTGVFGGYNNNISVSNSYIFGGAYHDITSGRGWIVGGRNSTHNGGTNGIHLGANDSTISAGNYNGILAGDGNTASHDYSVVIGGQSLSTSKADEVVVPSLTINGQALGNVGTISIASSTGSMDVSTANFFTLNLASGVDTHLDATNITAGKGQTITLFLRQNLTTAGTISFSPDFLFEGGTPFTVSTGLGAKDMMTFVSDGTNLFATGFKDFS